MPDIRRLGRHRQVPTQRSRTSRRWCITLVTLIVIGCTAAALFVSLSNNFWGQTKVGQSAQSNYRLPTTSSSYIGIYAHGVPSSYRPVKEFISATGIKPRVVVYYSGWAEPFQTQFAMTAANAGAVPLVQVNPTHVNIGAIAAGRYDNYLRTYAEAVRAYKHPVILSFGHEMNGYWYSWGYTHTSPEDFVAAWRHIVTLFRTLGAKNVTWLWTINTIHEKNHVPSPGPWWPGGSYVNWVGVDGYYTSPSAVFSSVFGPTIVYLRMLTRDPILITETSAQPAITQSAKIADLFAGVHLYRLLGFVWFNSVNKVDWRLSGPKAFAALRRGAETYDRDAP